MKTRLAAVVAVIVISLTACGSPEIAPDAKYESVKELRDAYLDSGVSDEECDEINDGAVEKWGYESVTCGQHTVLAVYLTDAAFKQSTSKEWNGPSTIPSDSSLITGPNWTIRTQTWNAENVQDVFGGKVEQGTLNK